MARQTKILFGLIFTFVIFGLLSAAMIQAADVRELRLNVPIDKLTGFSTASEGSCTDPTLRAQGATCNNIPWIAQYITYIYSYGIRVGALVAVLMIIIGGVMYMTALGKPEVTKKAKTMIFGPIMGLLILISSYVILNTVNPDLVNLNPVSLQVLKTQEFDVNDYEFCEDYLKTGNYNVEGYDVNTAKCGDGKSYKLSLKDAEAAKKTVMTRATCVASKCPPKNSCNKKQNGQYFCDSSFISGRIIVPDDGSIAGKISDAFTSYVDYVNLYELELGGYDDAIGSKASLESTDRTYTIQRVNDTDLKTENYYLQIEVNDKSFGWTNDDKYQIDAAGNPIGVVDSMCCTYKCKGKGMLSITNGCSWISKNQLQTKSTRIDINTANLYCGDTPMQESVDDLGNDYEVDKCYALTAGQLGVGQECSENKDCKSNDCEKEGNIKKCECNVDTDCIGEGAYCETSLTGFNICKTDKNKKKVGAACTDDSGCASDDCYNGICQCSTSNGCALGQVCEKKSGEPNLCVTAKKVGESCVDNWQCASKKCDTYCICKSNDDCAVGEMCDTTNSKPICIKKKGVNEICQTDEQCITDDCEYESKGGLGGGGVSRCECNYDGQCGTGEFCNKSWNTWNRCQKK